jgi:hypothetical protein
MSIQRIILLLVIMGGLVVFALENWSPIVALVILGGQTQALPLGLWLVGAIALGMLTTLILVGLALLLGSDGDSRPRRRSKPKRRRYSEPDPSASRSSSSFDSAGDRPRSSRRQTSKPNEENKAADFKSFVSPEPSTSAASVKAHRRPHDDWQSLGRSPQDRNDWESPAQKSSYPKSSYSQSPETVIQEEPVQPSTASSTWNRYEEPDDDDIDDDITDAYSYTGSETDIPDQENHPWSDWQRYDDFGSNSNQSIDHDDQVRSETASNIPFDDDSGRSDYDDDNDTNHDQTDYYQFGPGFIIDDDDDDDDDIDDLVEDWDDWDEDSSNPDDTASDPDDEPPPRRDIFEVNREPASTSKAGSIYSYVYKRSEDPSSGDWPDDDRNDGAPSDQETDARVIIPPYHDSSNSSYPSEPKRSPESDSSDNHGIT